MRNFRLALAQINTTVGDLEGNARKAIEYVGRARDAGADLVALPELTVTGYPPEDLVFRSQFVRENLERTRQIAAATSGITAVFGFVDDSGGLRNAAAIARDGRLDAVYHKRRLPNYGVFDEARYFVPGDTSPPTTWRAPRWALTSARTSGSRTRTTPYRSRPPPAPGC